MNTNHLMDLPTKLGLEPIVDTVCEIRLEANIQLSQVLPGYLFSKLLGDKNLTSTPSAMIPQQILAADPALKYQPLTELTWNNFVIRFSDHSVQVACQLPYPGWQSFKKAIIEVLTNILETGLIEKISRYSLKYIDFIPAETHELRAKIVDINLSLGKEKLTSNHFQVHLELPSEKLTHLVTVAAPAQAIKNSDNSIMLGVLITTDSIVEKSNLPTETDIKSQFEALIDHLHTENKRMFFNCLSETGLKLLEPAYD